MISRRQVAQYLVECPVNERQAAMRQVAAWLVASHREDEINYLVRDVAAELAEGGRVWSRVTSAHQLSTSTKATVEQFLRTQTEAKSLELELAVDPSLIGGVKLETATAELDASLRTQINQLAETSR